MAFAKIEFELKLVGPTDDVAAVGDLDFVRRAMRGEGEWARLKSTYYDSPDSRLAAKGLSLRIRDEGGLTTLTAKADDTRSGPVKRLECERAVAGDGRDFSTGIPEIDEIVGPETSDLVAVARTITDRWSAVVAENGAIIELSMEVGRAERLLNERRTTGISEVEIELLKGSPEVLFDWARRLVSASSGRMRLSAETKFDRAMRAGASPGLGKAPRPRLPPDPCTLDLINAALKPVAIRVIEASALVVAAHDRDAGRQLRVALRRFRLIERLFRKALDSAQMRHLAAEAKEFGRLIGAARDLDNFERRNCQLASAPAEFCARADSESAAAWNRAASALRSERFGLFTVDLLAAAMTDGWRASCDRRLLEPARLHTDDMLEKRWKKLCEAARSADFSVPASLHAVRIALKKLRYAAQFFRDLYDRERTKPMFSAMSALQEKLGDINDAVAAQEIADRMATGLGREAAKSAGFIAGYRCAEAALGARAAQADWAAFAALTPFWRPDSDTD